METKTKARAIAFALLVALAPFLGAKEFIRDGAGILTQVQKDALSAKLESISLTFPTDVFIVTAKSFSEYGYDTEDAAEKALRVIPFDDRRGCLLLFIAVKDRTYDLDVIGHGQELFSHSACNRLEQSFLSDFSSDDWNTGLLDLTECASTILMNNDAEACVEKKKQIAIMFAIALIVSIIISFALYRKEMKKLDNVALAHDADRYASGSLALSRSRDTYTHSTTRTIHHNENSSSGGGSRSHSHHSGHF